MGVERWTQAAGLTFVAAAAKARQPLLTAEPEHDGLGGYRSQRSPQTESGRTPVPCSMQKEYPFGYSFFIQRNRAQVRFLPKPCRRQDITRHKPDITCRQADITRRQADITKKNESLCRVFSRTVLTRQKMTENVLRSLSFFLTSTAFESTNANM